MKKTLGYPGVLYIIIVFFYHVSVAFAKSNNDHNNETISKEIMPDDKLIIDAANTEEWKNLLHYHGSGRKSEADDPSFFLSPNGNKDRVSELQATLIALSAPPLNTPYKQLVSAEDERSNKLQSHAQCRFPARFYWLKQEFPDWAEKVQEDHCENFNKWRDEVAPKSVTVIFPAAYMNSPSSMFGHTLLRIDSNKQSDNERLLSYTLNYAAELTEENSDGLKFFWKGLFGGYPGVISGAAYYEKVVQYNDMEFRDIWEYELNLSDQEIDQLLRHLWELQHIYFDYFFFDENCSYRILTVIDVARPGTQASNGFWFRAIPADTVRALYNKGLVHQKKYRPSMRSELNLAAKQLTSQQKQIAYDVAYNKISASDVLNTKQSKKEQAQVLDFSFDYLRYLVNQKRKPQGYAQQSLEILKQRSLIKEMSSLPHEQPVSPELGHKTMRTSLAYGSHNSETYQSLAFRPAFHDHLDDATGYVTGAQINFFDSQWRYYNEAKEMQLHHFTLVDVSSMAPRNQFFKPISWKVSTGLMRRYEIKNAPMSYEVEGGGGITQEISSHIRWSFLAVGNIYARLNDFNLGLGVETTVMFNVFNKAKLMLGTSKWWFKDSYVNGMQYLVGANLPLFSPNNALRINLRIEDRKIFYDKQWQLAWLHYF